MNRAFPSLLALLFLAGCAVGPDYERPEVATPVGWRLEADALVPVPTPLPPEAFYRDPVLLELIQTALAQNPDVRIALARMEQAAAAYRVERSALFPSINGSASWSTARAGNIPPVPGIEADQFNLFGLLSYEVDLWGRVRRLNEAALARYLATEEARRTVEVSLTAAVANTYFNLRALDEQLRIARETLESRQGLLDLTEIKFDNGNGIVSGLDVAQAQTQVATAESSIASIRRLIAVTENALSVLLGTNPREIPRGRPLGEQWDGGEVPLSLPSEILLQRPDLRAAEQQLIAANADIGAARAAYFPTLSLTGALGLQSEDLDNLFDTGLSKAWSFEPGLTAPIFNAGRIRAGVAAAEAARREALAQYEKSIQNAFREVDDAVAGIVHLQEQLVADRAVVAAEKRRLELSTLRYEGGVASYSDVLDAQRFLFNAELGAVQTRNDLLNALVQLYKALGWGGGDGEHGP